MAEFITTDSRPSYGVTFERTISDGNYGSNKFSAWVSADVAPDATETQKYDALADAARVAKALVFDQLGVDAHADDAQVIRETVKRVERAFPNTQIVEGNGQPAPVANAQAIGVRVKGELWNNEPLPTWLIEECAKHNVTEVWDNRGSVAGTNKPFFKPTTKIVLPNGKDLAFWPPKGR